MKISLRKENGITLVVLIVTIIVLIILASMTVMVVINNGIMDKTIYAGEETRKQAATETMNLKITNAQMIKYTEEQRLPTLKEVADIFCEDEDFQYVYETSQIASLTPVVSENPSSIYTKLKEYPYEFEINSSLQLASINGIQIANTEKIPEGYIKPSGTKTIETNGEHNIAEYEKVNVNVPTYELGSKLKISTKSDKIDVSRYQYIDTTELYTKDEAQSGEGTYWASGVITATPGVNSINLGFVPSQITFSKQNGSTMRYDSYVSTSNVFTYTQSKGYLTFPFNSTDAGNARILSIGKTVTFRTHTDQTTTEDWHWFAIK